MASAMKLQLDASEVVEQIRAAIAEGATLVRIGTALFGDRTD